MGIILAIILLVMRRVIKKEHDWNNRLAAGYFGLFIALLAINYVLTAPPEKQVPAVTHRNPELTDIVQVKQGEVRGVYTKDHEVEIFAGSPYAKPPVGELRWKEPQEPDSWAGVRECDEYAPMSMQPSSSELYKSLTQILGTHDYRFSL